MHIYFPPYPQKPNLSKDLNDGIKGKLTKKDYQGYFNWHYWTGYRTVIHSNSFDICHAIILNIHTIQVLIRAMFHYDIPLSSV